MTDAEKVRVLRTALESLSDHVVAQSTVEGSEPLTGEMVGALQRARAALLATAPEPEPVLGRCPCGGTLVRYGSSDSTAPESVVWADHLTCLFCAKTAPLPGREGGGR